MYKRVDTFWAVPEGHLPVLTPILYPCGKSTRYEFDGTVKNLCPSWESNPDSLVVHFAYFEVPS